VYLDGAVRGQAFRLRAFESRFREGGEYVDATLPRDAALITVHQSGSIRFYSGRPTLVWGFLEPSMLDRAVDHLRARGYRPYLLFETWEESGFRKRFEGKSRLGSLIWPPRTELNRQIRIYDPADYEPYMQGTPVRTSYVWTSRR
jgi:hypothetical protein